MDRTDTIRHRLATLGQHLPRLRRPAHTGQNRCWPCTVLNGAIVVVLALVLSSYSYPLATLVFVGGALLVALRGYVVPGTPRFAPELVASLPVEFGHAAEIPSGTLGGDTRHAIDAGEIMELLVEGGVLRAEGGDLFLDESFRRAWEDRQAELRNASEETVTTRAAAAAGEDVEAQFEGNRLLLASERDVWLSPAVAIAETAAVETLAEWHIPEHIRAPAAQPLRTFVETCPVCGQGVCETTLQNCCGGPGSLYENPERGALACTDCEAVAFVFEPDRTPE